MSYLKTCCDCGAVFRTDVMQARRCAQCKGAPAIPPKPRAPLAPCTAPRTVTHDGKRITEWRGRPCYGGYLGERHF